jgi:tRNA uridine 5-carboxymethylaminomethyl modification enzyme
MGCGTLLITLNINDIANMPCNPSVGGPAKAQLVREIDALGGEMALNTDKTRIQMRMINTGKGPAVRALRAQADKQEYRQAMRETLYRQERLAVTMAEVESILIREDCPRACGVITKTGAMYQGKAVVLTAGTFLRGRIIMGDVMFAGGPGNQFPALRLSERLVELGIKIGRFKTGTPPRIDRKTVDFSQMEEQPGDQADLRFSFLSPPNRAEQLSCWLTRSNPETHRIVRENLDRAPMFTGVIQGRGPRYCPSFEDKVVRFAHKESHQLFIEPEGRCTDEMYVQGLNTSLPEDVQIRALRSIRGLERVHMMRTGYAIEYDYVLPSQLTRSLEIRQVEGLFSAGQINGTSGYEEAAAQGIVAGINAALKAQGREPFVLKRDEAYIGVLIDDLVSKDLDEPYRLLTSRAEYRLLLRQDNADLRLTEHGRRIGLVDDRRYACFQEKTARLAEQVHYLQTHGVTPGDSRWQAILHAKQSAGLHERVSLWELLRRPEISLEDLIRQGLFQEEDAAVAEQLQIQTKYAGYIAKQLEQVKKFEKMENKRLPVPLDYHLVYGLSNEAKQRLTQAQPESLGQASRLAGVNPADINVLLIYLQKKRKS